MVVGMHSSGSGEQRHSTGARHFSDILQGLIPAEMVQYELAPEEPYITNIIVRWSFL